MHEIETTQPRHTVVGDSLFLLLLGISLFVVFPHAAISGDHARDLGIAADLVDGRHLPMNSPLLAGLFHLGPAWYCLLAVSNLAFGSAPAPTVRLNCADERRLPVASDAVTRLFKTNCGEPLALQIESQAPEHLDVVVLRPDLSP